MKKKHIITIAILLILFVVIGFFVIKNKSNISALISSVYYSDDHLEKMEIENEQKTQESLKGIGLNEVRPLTEEEQKALESGEISEEDAINIVIGKTTLDNIQKPDQTNNPPKEDPIKQDPVKQEDPKPVKPSNKVSQEEIDKANERVSQLIGKMYVLKSQFTAKLVALENKIISEYKALPDEQRKMSTKIKYGRQALAEADVYEADCDQQVNAILKEMESLLKATGQDTSIVSTIKSSYEKEKQTTKSKYINKYR